METEKRDRREVYREILGECPRLLQAAEALGLPSDDPAVVAAGYVLGPGLACFSRWLLEQAGRHGKKRLYFLARDGYFMRQAAQVFCRAWGLELDCRYLSCSRYSLRLPLFHLDHERALEHVCRSGVEVTPWRLLGRAGLTPEEREGVLHALALPMDREEPLPPAVLPELRRRLAACAPFLEGMDRPSREAVFCRGIW